MGKNWRQFKNKPPKIYLNGKQYDFNNLEMGSSWVAIMSGLVLLTGDDGIVDKFGKLSTAELEKFARTIRIFMDKVADGWVVETNAERSLRIDRGIAEKMNLLVADMKRLG